MAVKVDINNTGDPQNEKRVQAVLEGIPTDENVSIHIVGTHNTSKWAITVTSSKGTTKFEAIGENGECEAEPLRARIEGTI